MNVYIRSTDSVSLIKSVTKINMYSKHIGYLKILIFIKQLNTSRYTYGFVTTSFFNTVFNHKGNNLTKYSFITLLGKIIKIKNIKIIFL